MHSRISSTYIPLKFITIFFPFSSYRKVISSFQEPIFKFNRGLTISEIPKGTNTATKQTGIQAVSEH